MEEVEENVPVEDGKKEKEGKPKVKTVVDLQRLKLEKLMKNPDKPVIIPERPKERSAPHVPDFVRNVMGSSAGAGSGEFHVYRHLRRKEYARQKYIHEKAEKDRLNDEYHQKLEENRLKAEEKTAKKRAKRLKRKQKMKQAKKKKVGEKSQTESENSNSDDEDQESSDGQPEKENPSATEEKETEELSPNVANEESNASDK